MTDHDDTTVVAAMSTRAESEIEDRRAGRRYLLTSAVSAVVVANAWRPFVRVGYPVIGTYLAGIVPSELPLLAAAVALGETAAAARRGALRSTAGRVGLALMGASLGGLVALERSARNDHRILEHALVEALGSSYRSRLATLDVPERSVAPRFSHPFPRTGRRSLLLAERDLPYGPAGKRNLLDIWRHPDLTLDTGAPVVVQIHGGGWITGSKQLQGVPLLTYLSSRGWVGVSINYRLSPQSAWPDGLVDVKRALAWVRGNIARYGGDPSFIAVTGGSAGGHLSALAALTSGNSSLQPGFEHADTRVQAAIPFYGAYDITDLEGTGRRDAIRFWEHLIMKTPYEGDDGLWVTASPVLNARADASPMFVIHGRQDALVRVEQARFFVQRLRESGAPIVAYAELPNARHAFDVFDTVRTQAVAAAVERFLQAALFDHRCSTGTVAD